MACVAVGCKSRKGVLLENNQKLSFHRFPKSPDLRDKWVKNMNRSNWVPSPYSRLCALHFNESCYREGYETKVLHSDAVPTIFAHVPSALQKKSVRRARPSRLELRAPSTPNTNVQKEVLQLKETILEQKKIIQQLKKIVEHYRNTAERRGKALKRMRQQFSRRNKKPVGSQEDDDLA